MQPAIWMVVLVRKFLGVLAVHSALLTIEPLKPPREINLLKTHSTGPQPFRLERAPHRNDLRH